MFWLPFLAINVAFSQVVNSTLSFLHGSSLTLSSFQSFTDSWKNDLDPNVLGFHVIFKDLLLVE